MTQIVLNISSKKKWDALKPVLEAMKIDYLTPGTTEEISEKELELLHNAANDVVHGRVTPYTNHSDILGR